MCHFFVAVIGFTLVLYARSIRIARSYRIGKIQPCSKLNRVMCGLRNSADSKMGVWEAAHSQLWLFYTYRVQAYLGLTQPMYRYLLAFLNLHFFREAQNRNFRNHSITQPNHRLFFPIISPLIPHTKNSLNPLR